MKLRKLTEAGRIAFRDWLSIRQAGENPPSELLDGAEQTDAFSDVEVDPRRRFTTRYEFGVYIADLLAGLGHKTLLLSESDGLWDWLTVVYFEQFGRKVSRSWHYTVTRKGHSGSLAYRHLARTAFEMVWRHGEAARVMLNVEMSTWGDMSEQLTSRQNVAYNRGYILAANALYMSGEKLRRGSASRVRPPSKRKPGETTGKGGVARLALAVRRLCRTYDTHVLGVGDLLGLLPREFATFIAQA